MAKTRGRAVKQASQPRLTFKELLGYEVANPETWVLRPGSTNDSIWKLVVDADSKAWAEQPEREMLARVCPRSNDINTVSRQLGYYRFQRLDKTGVHVCDVEIEPGRTVSAKYVEYTHVPHETEKHSVWSNARGYPHKDHRRRTNHGLGNGGGAYTQAHLVLRKRKLEECLQEQHTADKLLQNDDGAYTQAHPVLRKRKLEECLQEQHTVDELLQNDDVVNDIIKQFASDYVDDDHVDEDILRMVDINVDSTTMEALALLM